MIFGRLLLTVLAILVGGAGGVYDPWEDTAHYELTYRVDCSAFVEKAQRSRLWIPLPRTNTYQRLVRYDVEAAVGFAELTDDYGNRMIYVEPPSGAGKTTDVMVRMFVERKVARVSSSSASASGVDDPARYLGATRMIPLDGVVGAIGQRESAGISDPSRRARALYGYVVSSMRYSKEGTGWGRGDAVRACNAKYGNCTDFHSLLMGMSRSQGIASRFVIGFPVPVEKTEGSIGGYHCWAEVFDKTTGWVPVDASEAYKSGRTDAYFGTLPSDRVAFTVGRDLTLNPPQAGPPLNFFVYPYAECDDRAVPNVPWEVTFTRAVLER